MEQDNRNTYEYTNERIVNGTYYQRPEHLSEKQGPNTVYYQRPGQMTDASGTPIPHTPVVPANAFAKASFTIGGIALVSVFTFTIFPAIILGALSLILALLSRGAELTFHKTAKNGILMSVMAMVVNVILVGGTCFLILGDTPYHDQINETYEEMFGISYDELLEGVMNGTIETDDLYEQLYEQMQEDMQ